MVALASGLSCVRVKDIFVANCGNEYCIVTIRSRNTVVVQPVRVEAGAVMRLDKVVPDIPEIELVITIEKPGAARTERTVSVRTLRNSWFVLLVGQCSG
jgi:hypothetical protein